MSHTPLSAPAARKASEQRLRDLEASAQQYGVPLEDALLIAVNLFGITSEHQERHRARVNLRLVRQPAVPWQVIVPLNQPASPFRLRHDELLLNGKLIAHVERIDADEAVGGYFRNNGRAATLNPNARSRCVGCAFCPNTLEAAADPRLAEERGLDELLLALAEQHPRGDLTELTEVTVSTGCFEREEAALSHLTALRSALSRAGVQATIGFLTSVLRTDTAFDILAKQVAPFVLRLTAECFTRRPVMLKDTKASLLPEEMPDLLARARSCGLETSYTYIVGLDPLPDLVGGIQAMAEVCTRFPNFQVFQAHTPMMAGLRTAGAETLGYYLSARQAIETVMAPTGLRPVGWECYRPLWYFTYAGQELLDGRG
ncbi:hypothetical protein OG585_47170 (plasmid) [Streptomyces sp. NBC_01340]|uniref:hypothetical protein n=1 Tax=unclassified Streptomyces TaxID=2593676 RepID=UPI0022554F3C|nr:MULTISPECIES: hypothetical protein [unclassified Streptomyces]MCX4461164.1 hypothetical protein [Streptomyces sp. NBC_01719]MCX4499507.1 hypothetical protein [Streptomyces sp. NBC_01728]WSI44648.1 hypothetical protein OG585_47170 [Streptomyces sp. NBC_01340]